MYSPQLKLPAGLARQSSLRCEMQWLEYCKWGPKRYCDKSCCPDSAQSMMMSRGQIRAKEHKMHAISPLGSMSHEMRTAQSSFQDLPDLLWQPDCRPAPPRISIFAPRFSDFLEYLC